MQARELGNWSYEGPLNTKKIEKKLSIIFRGHKNGFQCVEFKEPIGYLQKYGNINQHKQWVYIYSMYLTIKVRWYVSHKDINCSWKHEIQHRVIWYEREKPLWLCIGDIRSAQFMLVSAKSLHLMSFRCHFLQRF